MALTEKLTTIADAIRSKTGKSEAFSLEQMATEIADMETGGGGITVDDMATRSAPVGDITVNAEKIERWAFSYCLGITGVSAPNTTQTGANAFNGCQNIKNFYLPKAGIIGQNTFYSCHLVKELELPSVYQLDYGAITAGGGSALEKLDLGPWLKKTGGTAFSNHKVLTILILRRTESIVALSNVNDFSNTPFAANGTGGTVYVPSALIETYKTATNWSTLYAAGTCNFVALEGSEYE